MRNIRVLIVNGIERELYGNDILKGIKERIKPIERRKPNNFGDILKNEEAKYEQKRR